MSFTLNPQVLEKLSAIALAKRLKMRRSSEDNSPVRRQKCISECIPLKTVDYDDLSDSSRSGLDTNLAKFQYIDSQQINPSTPDDTPPDWSNFKSLLVKEGAYKLFNTNSDNCSSNEASEVETAPSVIKLTDENFSKKFKKNSVGQVQNYHLDQVCEYFDLSKKELKKLDVFCCKHTEKRHRAKFMCHSCYHQKGNTKKASACEHSDRPHYS